VKLTVSIKFLLRTLHGFSRRNSDKEWVNTGVARKYKRKERFL
jgi:hypothetical protein